MNNERQKCNIKELTDRIEYNVRKLKDTGLIITERKINKCDICTGYDLRCKGYHPINHYKETGK